MLNAQEPNKQKDHILLKIAIPVEQMLAMVLEDFKYFVSHHTYFYCVQPPGQRKYAFYMMFEY